MRIATLAFTFTFLRTMRNNIVLAITTPFFPYLMILSGPLHHFARGPAHPIFTLYLKEKCGKYLSHLHHIFPHPIILSISSAPSDAPRTDRARSVRESIGRVPISAALAVGFEVAVAGMG